MKVPPEQDSVVPNTVTHTTDNDITAATLNALFESNNQTYEQFLDSFTHLNTVPTGDAATRPDAIGTRNGIHSNGAPPDVSRAFSRGEAEDDLEEEILEEGSTIPSVLNSLDVPATPNRVQLDNFVVANDSSDDEDDTNGYVASFDRATRTESGNESEDPLRRLGDGVRTILTSNDDEQWPLNPGEVGEDLGETPSVDHVTNFRLPDVEYRMKTMEECIREAEETQPSTDRVEPFCLDDQFDYDNVALTPKFTEEERAYLKSCSGTPGLV